MSRIFRTANVPVKATRKTERPAGRFGQGILPYRPFAGVMPFSQADLDWATQSFNDDSEPDYDAMALEAEYQSRYESQAPVTYGRCLSCNGTFDYLEANGLCPRCDIHASEVSTPNRYR
jgi:hypothetical protein